MTARPWTAPQAPYPIRARVVVPGSKSETARALVLAALADGPSVIRNGLVARDTELMISALEELGVVIERDGAEWHVRPPDRFTGGGLVDCGLAGTVMRFVPPVAALADSRVEFTGDEQAFRRPMGPLLDGLRQLGVGVEGDRLPFVITGPATGADGPVVIDASTSSQYVTALLLIGSRLPDGVVLELDGEVPSRPHIQMTVEMLRDRGVKIDETEESWRVHPGPITAVDVDIQPDLSNAAPFLAAAAVTGGTVTVAGWPYQTSQPGDRLRHVFDQFGCETALDVDGFTVSSSGPLDGIELDLGDASELTPVVAAVCALAQTTSRIRGVAHIRGHETDRLAALEHELDAVGSRVRQTEDGLVIHPAMLHGAPFGTYADHRMAQAGAVLGLIVAGVELDDIGCTSKTMPEFPELWQQMIDDAVASAETVPAD